MVSNKTNFPRYSRGNQPRTPFALLPAVGVMVRVSSITLVIVIGMLLERALGLPLVICTVAYLWISRLPIRRAYLVSLVLGIVLGASWNLPFWMSVSLMGAGTVWVRQGGMFIESLSWRVILIVFLITMLIIGVHRIELGVWSFAHLTVWILGLIWMLLPGVRWSIGTTRSFRVSPRLLNQLESLKE